MQILLANGEYQNLEGTFDFNQGWGQYTPTAQEKIDLAMNGFVWRSSSWIYGIRQEGNDLLVALLNKAVYRYPGKGHVYQGFFSANSPGRYWWANVGKKASFIREKDLDGAPMRNFSLEDMTQSISNQEKQYQKIMQLILTLLPSLAITHSNVTGMDYAQLMVNGVEILFPIVQ